MNSSLIVSTKKVFPTSSQIKDYYINNFKGTISLEVDRDIGRVVVFSFMENRRDYVPMRVIVRKSKDKPFRNPLTGTRIDNEVMERENEYRKYRVDMQGGNMHVLCILRVDDWAQSFASGFSFSEKETGEGPFGYLGRISNELFDFIDRWMLDNLIISLESEPVKENNGIGIPLHDFKISMVNGKEVPSAIKLIGNKLRSSTKIVHPDFDDPDCHLLAAALDYERKTSEFAIAEAQKAHAGCVDVKAFIAKAEVEYLEVLRGASSEFRKQFNIV